MTTVRPALAAAARVAIAARTEAIFRQSGALTDGHFRLKSGRHSERYLEKFLVLQDPVRLPHPVFPPLFHLFRKQSFR